ncbi:MAG: hypothetical protein ACLR0N_01955 [Bilophila wadsworthia]
MNFTVAEQVAERLTQPETVAYEPVGDVSSVRAKADVPLAQAGRSTAMQVPSSARRENGAQQVGCLSASSSE